MTADSITSHSATSGAGAPPATAPPSTSRLAGACMLLGAGCLVLAEAIHVQVGGQWSPEALVTSLASRPERWLLWSLLLMSMSLLVLPGVIAWRWRVRLSGVRRGQGLTTIGSTVLGAALVGMFGFGAMHAQNVAMLSEGTPVPAVLVEAFAVADGSVGVGVTAGLALLGFHVGVPVFLAGMARAGAIRWWVAALGGVAAIAAMFVGSLHWYLATGAFAVTAAVLGYLGLRLFTSWSGPVR